MQKQEFNNLYEGKDAKWVDLFKSDEEVKRQIQKIEAPSNKPTIVQIKKVREIIENNEIAIPPETKKQIDEFIAQQRRFGLKERAIKNKVKRKFNIIVI